jgi:hypothetical protein
MTEHTVPFLTALFPSRWHLASLGKHLTYSLDGGKRLLPGERRFLDVITAAFLDWHFTSPYRQTQISLTFALG